MNYKRILKVFIVTPLLLVLNSCMSPATESSNTWTGFPSSTTETHTKTTIVTPPSYATVNIPSPVITQGSPVVQQPIMYQAPSNGYAQPYAPQYAVAMPQAQCVALPNQVQAAPLKLQAAPVQCVCE